MSVSVVGVVLISLWPLPLSAYISLLRSLGLSYAAPSLFCCISKPGRTKLVLIYSFWVLRDVCVRCVCECCGWFGWFGLDGWASVGWFGRVRLRGYMWVGGSGCAVCWVWVWVSGWCASVWVWVCVAAGSVSLS